jgi:quercetin dioxygenase-like cupin family protein
LFEILIGELPPNYHYPPVAHEGEEFGFVLEGRLALRVGEESYELGPGDSYHFLATVPHGYETDEQETARVLWVQTLKYSGLPVGMGKTFVRTAQEIEPGYGTNAE